MKKQLHILLLTFLILGQTILGPVGVAGAEEFQTSELSADQNQEQQEINNQSDDEKSKENEGTQGSDEQKDVGEVVPSPGDTNGDGGEKPTTESEDDKDKPNNGGGNKPTEGDLEEDTADEIDEVEGDVLDEEKQPNSQAIPLTEMKFEMSIKGTPIEEYKEPLKQDELADIKFVFTANTEAKDEENNTAAHVKGSSFSFELPDSIIDYNNNFYSAEPVISIDGVKFSYKTENNIVTVVLEEDVLPKSNQEFTMAFKSGFILKGDKEERELIFPSGIGENQTEKIILNFLPKSEDTEKDKTIITENIIKELKLIRKDESVYIEGDQLELGEDLKLELEWSLPNDHAYGAGSTFEFQLPKQLNIYNELVGDLNGYGSYLVKTDGHVTFTFNENINEESDIKGTFWVETVLKKEEITSTEEVLEVKFNEQTVKSISITIKPIGGQSISKEGQPVGGNFNANEIEWTVTINTMKDMLENAVVTDPIPEGLELIVDSIKLQEVNVDLDGKVAGVVGDIESFENESSHGELKLKLGDTNKAYQLTFRTIMKEEEKEGTTTYKNTVYLTSEGKERKESSASVSVERPKSLTKTSTEFNKGERSVEWEVKANFTQKDLQAGDTITDEFTFTVDGKDQSDVFEVKKEEIKIFQVDSFKTNGDVENTSEANDLFTIKNEGNKVTYTLKEATNKAFVIKYKTNAKKDAYINKDGTISNSVTVGGKVATSSQGIIQQVGSKSNGGIDYANKTISWTIVINADKQDLRNFVLTDNFSGSGQKLVESSLKIDPSVEDSKINLKPDKIPEGEGFEINFGDIKDTYTITYQTKFTYDFTGETKPDFKNGVTITYKTSDGAKYDLEIGDKANPNPNTKNNGVKNGTVNNETKEITWTVDINYNNLHLKDVKVIDEIAENQSLIKGSVKVMTTSIDGSGNITTVADVTNTDQFKDKISIENNQIKVDFDKINSSYRVEFKTKDKDGIYNGDEVYENTAQFFQRGEEVHNLSASVTLPNQGEFLGKSGVHNKEDWTVDWKIDVNKSKSKLTNVLVEDDLGDGKEQILLEDTIKVKKGEVEINKDAYELNVQGNKFSIEFKGEITDEYQIVYSSYIVAEKSTKIKNEAKIGTLEKTVGNKTKTEEVDVKFSTGGGTAEGSTGELIIEKEENNFKPLKNVKFMLVKKIGNQEITVRESTTNEDGEIHWKGLKYGEYTLIEDVPLDFKSADGFEKNGEDKATKKITISNSDPQGIKIEKIKNARKIGIAKIIKVDAATDKQIPGAKFSITNLITDESFTLTTEANGEVSKDVPFGEYSVKETTAPEGYRITKDIENIYVEAGKTAEIKVKNVAIDEVVGEKSWIDRNGEDRPQSIIVNLMANGKKIDEKKVTDQDHWKYKFTDLDVYDENGKVIEYTVSEEEAEDLKDYRATVKNFDILNELAIGEVELTKVDSRNSSKKLKGAEFKLEKVLNENVVLTIQEGLKTTEDGILVVKNLTDGNYQFIETKAPSGYLLNAKPVPFVIGGDKQINKVTLKVENAKRPTGGGGDPFPEPEPKINVSGSKTWAGDKASDRPTSITINLLQNGVLFQHRKVTAQDNWTYTFTDLPEVDSKGNKYSYTIDEESVAGYVKEIKGYNVTNTLIETMDISGTKTWIDDKAKDRPDSIKVNLLQNEIVLDTVTVTKEDGWKYSFKNLKVKDKNGVAYKYTITEEPVDGYKTIIDGYDITNVSTDNPKPEEPDNPEDPNKPGPEDPNKPDPNDPNKPGPEDPNKPDPNDPNKPGPEDPNKPNPNDPNKPGPEDPNKPDPNDPNKPGPEDPNKPIPNDPNKPGPEDPNKPNPNDPNKPGPEDPNKPNPNDPNKPGPEDPNKPDPENPNDPDNPGTDGSNDPDNPGTSGKPGKPSHPGNSGTPVKPNKPGQSGSIADPNKNNGYQWANKGSKLPQTGEAYPILPLTGGFLLILAGLLVLRRKKKHA